MKVIISGGGTGGHIFPAIAIANAIKSSFNDAEILFVGAEGKMEMEKVPQAGYKIIGLPIVGIQRRLTWKNLLVPFKVLASMSKAKKIIHDFKPDIAIGVGGYASGPLLRAAASAGVPTLIQEQNSYAGITNKILAKKAGCICVAYSGMEAFFPKEKIVMTGNPVRAEMVQLDGKRTKALKHFGLSDDRKTILIVGGSLGARTINHAVSRFASEWVSAGHQVVWQTGKAYFETAKMVAASQNHIFAHDFIREMDLAYSAADVIVSRAGAMSISELCLVKKPAILIPSPNVSEDHQTKNAMALVNRSAALLVPDTEAETALGAEVLQLLSNQEKVHSLSENIATLGIPNAPDLIVKQVMALIKK